MDSGSSPALWGRGLTEALLGDGDVLVKVLHAALLREVGHSVPGASEDPLGGQKPLQAHRASGMDPCRTDADLSSCRMIKLAPLTR